MSLPWHQAIKGLVTVGSSLTKEKLVNHLIKLRHSRNTTQTQLAAAIGKPQSYVSKYESGERNLDFIEVIEIIRALGADPVDQLKQLL